MEYWDISYLRLNQKLKSSHVYNMNTLYIYYILIFKELYRYRYKLYNYYYFKYKLEQRVVLVQPLRGLLRNLAVFSLLLLLLNQLFFPRHRLY